MSVMEATLQCVQPHAPINHAPISSETLVLKLDDTSAAQDLTVIRRFANYVEQLNSDTSPTDLPIRSSVSEHRWKNMLNNSFLTLDCLEAMINSGRRSDAAEMLPIAVRALKQLGL